MPHYEAGIPQPAEIGLLSSTPALRLTRGGSITWTLSVERRSDIGSPNFVSKTVRG